MLTFLDIFNKLILLVLNKRFDIVFKIISLFQHDRVTCDAFIKQSIAAICLVKSAAAIIINAAEVFD
jgi:hypothetical protein